MIAASQLKKLVHRVSLYDDALAYKELFLLYHSRLVKFSSSITHSKELAEEVVSDAFLKLWTSRNNLARVENFHLYVYVSVKNLSINAVLREKRTSSFSIDEIKVDPQSLQHNPEQLMMSGEMLRKIENSIASLPARCQLIFKLVKEDGLKYREVAELLELSLKTVENQMTIALKKLGEAIRFNPATPRPK